MQTEGQIVNELFKEIVDQVMKRPVAMLRLRHIVLGAILLIAGNIGFWTGVYIQTDIPMFNADDSILGPLWISVVALINILWIGRRVLRITLTDTIEEELIYRDHGPDIQAAKGASKNAARSKSRPPSS
jgi:uncharacterized membrane protein